MGIEKGHNQIDNLEFNQKQVSKSKDIQEEISKVKKGVDLARDYNKAGELEAQVGPVLESVGVPEKRVEDVVDKLIKLGKDEITKFIKKLNSYLSKENKKSLIDGLIQRLEKRSSINENKEDIKEENTKESKNNKDIKEETKIEKENQNNTKENQNNTKENKEDINLKKEKKEGNINNTTEYKKFQKNFQNLEKIASSLSNNEQYSSYLSVLSDYRGKEINESNRKEIITRLKQALSPQVLTNIVKDLGVNTKEYRDFKNSLISIEGGEGGYFRSQFEMIEQVGVYNFPHPLTPSPLEERGKEKIPPF